MLKNKRYLIFPILLLIFLAIGVASASDNITDDMIQEEVPSQDIDQTPVSEEIKCVENESSPVSEEIHSKIDTKIKSKKVTTYYKEDSQLVSYLKDSNNKPIANKKVSISINNKIYKRISDNSGKVVLKLNLKPGTYTAVIKFAGDGNYTANSTNTVVKVKKSILTVTTSNYKTYFESGFFFKAKVINKVTKNPVKNVKVAFKVYKNSKYKIYYGTTDANGVAKLNKNLKLDLIRLSPKLRKANTLKLKNPKQL